MGCSKAKFDMELEMVVQYSLLKHKISIGKLRYARKPKIFDDQRGGGIPSCERSITATLDKQWEIALFSCWWAE